MQGSCRNARRSPHKAARHWFCSRTFSMDFASAFNFTKKLGTTRRKLASPQSAEQFVPGATPFHTNAPTGVSCERFVVHAPAPSEQELALTMRKWKDIRLRSARPTSVPCFSAARLIRSGGYERGRILTPTTLGKHKGIIKISHRF